MKKLLALCFLSLVIFNVQAQGADITQYDVGVRMQGPNPDPTPLGELTGTGTAPEQYNIIRQDVRDVLKSSSDQMKSDVKADRPARDSISVGSTGSTVGNKSSVMSKAYNDFVTSTPCAAGSSLQMEGYFTGVTGGACVTVGPGDATYCSVCTPSCLFVMTTDCMTCNAYCNTSSSGPFANQGGT